MGTPRQDCGDVMLQSIWMDSYNTSIWPRDIRRDGFVRRKQLGTTCAGPFPERTPEYSHLLLFGWLGGKFSSA